MEKTAPETLFLNAARDGISPSTAVSLLNFFIAAGPFDISRKDPETSRTFLQSWWYFMERKYDLPPEYFIGLAARSETSWTHRDFQGKTLGQMVLDTFISEYATSPNTVNWLRLLPEEVLREGLSSRSPLLGELLKKKAHAAVDVLMDRGWTLLGSIEKGGQPLASLISTPSQWDAYLRQGGSPDVLVTAYDDIKTPLWQYLRKNTSPELLEAIDAWALKEKPDVLAKKKDEEYWKSIEQNHGAQQSLSAIAAEKDWPIRRDPQGRSVLMVVKNRSALRSLIKRPKARSSNVADPDMWGRNLWAYWFAQGFISADIKDFLKIIPPSVTPSGDGLLQQCFVAYPEDKPVFSQHDAFRNKDPSSFNVWKEQMLRSSDLVWGAGTEAHERLAHWIVTDLYWGNTGMGMGSSLASLPQALACWMVMSAPPCNTPLLNGALSMVLVSGWNHYKLDKDRAEKQLQVFENKGLLLPPRSTWSSLTIKMWSGLPDDVRNRLEKASLKFSSAVSTMDKLDDTLASVTPPPAASRLRM